MGEAWQREALLRAQAGDIAQVAAMLNKLPPPLQLEQLLAAPQAGESLDDPKLASLEPKIGAPLSSRPPSSTVGDAPLSAFLKEEEVPDWTPPASYLQQRANLAYESKDSD